MIGIIIAAHGNFSEELLKSSEMIYGSQTNIAAVTFKPGESTESLVDKYNTLINKFDCVDGILFMVDLFGGSPFNAASILALKNDNMEIVTGVNIPMLLEVFGSKDFSSLSELLVIAQNSGKESIRQLVKKVDKDLKEDDL